MTDKQLPATIERGAVAAADFLPMLDLQQAIDRRNAIVLFTQKIMVEKIDYGVIPGVDKPSLLQPGAEKLIAFFGLTPIMELVDKIEDWTGRDHGGEPLFFYRYRCTLKRGERVLGAEEASANSWEVKYRYRWVSEAQVPAGVDKERLPRRDSSITEFEFAVSKAETAGQYGKPAEYWAKFNEAIANKTAVLGSKQARSGKSMPAWTIPGAAYRIPNPENADVINTIMQMAEKRAKIRAVRSCTGASEFYTQDVEDMTIIEGAVIAARVDARFADVAETATEAKPERAAPQKPAQDSQREPSAQAATQPQSAAGPATAAPTDPAAKEFYEDEAVLKLKEAKTISDATKIFNSIPQDVRRPGGKVFAAFKARREELTGGSQ